MKISRLAAVCTALMMMPTATLAAEAATTFEISDAGSVTIDATVSHEATPDSVGLSLYCDFQTAVKKPDLRSNMRKTLGEIRALVGTNGKVRMVGGFNYYYSYQDPTAAVADQTFTGNVSMNITGMTAAQLKPIAEKVEDKGCTVTWDARIYYSGKYAKQMREELMERIDDKKEFIESLLGVKMNKVSYISISTSPDNSYGGSVGYSATGGYSYDPESNTMQAMTTLSITFDIGKGVTK